MEKVSKKELQTRREFFKQAAKGVLPILGLTILGPTLASCDKVFGGDCNDCSDSCSDSCVTGCKNGCSASCSSSCKGSCQTVCTTTCKGSCSRRFSK